MLRILLQHFPNLIPVAEQHYNFSNCRFSSLTKTTTTNPVVTTLQILSLVVSLKHHLIYTGGRVISACVLKCQWLPGCLPHLAHC